MKSRNKAHRVNTVVTIFYEGDTEEEFYKKLISYIREKRGGRLNCRIEYKNLKGIGNYDSKLSDYFRNKICVDYKGYTIKVALCYDTDVFRGYKIKPVDWKIIEKKLRKSGATEIIHVRAETSIEDWFLCDKEGLRRYLRLPKKFKMTGYKGLEGLTDLFMKAGIAYKKGEKCKNLINYLDLEVILANIDNEINGLLKIIK